MRALEETGEISTVRSKYVIGCDGSRSIARTAIGRELVGDATNESWGVMDVLAVTDFPDVRVKCAIYSEQGNILIIPREGGYLVRFYIELDQVSSNGVTDSHSFTPEKLVEVANRILHPYTVEVKDVGCGRCTRSGSGFATRSTTCRCRRGGIAFRACSSPAMPAARTAPRRSGHERVDGRHVEPRLEARRRPQGRAKPELLHTYSAERQQDHRDLSVDKMPQVLLPRKGKFGLTDYEKIVLPEPEGGRHLPAPRREP
jgi:phenol 2-monooxygenase